jgi:hypothetical protein
MYNNNLAHTYRSNLYRLLLIKKKIAYSTRSKVLNCLQQLLSMTDFIHKYKEYPGTWHVFINLHSAMAASNLTISKCLLIKLIHFISTVTQLVVGLSILLTFHTFIHRLVVWKCSCLRFWTRLNKKYCVWLKQNGGKKHVTCVQDRTYYTNYTKGTQNSNVWRPRN